MAALSPKALTALVLVSLALTVILLVVVVVLLRRLGAVQASYRRLLRGGDGREDFVAATDRHIAHVDELSSKLDLVGREVARVRQRTSMMLQGVGFTRYDAFPDMGGQLSYSAALVNEAGDGVVLSAINGRSESRSYAKPLRAGTSTYNLSDEELEAVALALGEAGVARHGARAAAR